MFSRLNMPWLVLGGTVVLVTGLGSLLLWKDPGKRADPLIIQCAAALREPMEEIIPLFEQQKGIPIEVRYGESASILTNLRVTNQGDIFLPADDSYITDAQDLLGDVLPLAKMNAALVVNPDFHGSINTWEDLFKGETRIAIANPNAAAISRAVKTHLDASTWKRINTKVVEMGPVTQVANAVKNDRNITAGIIWDSMLSSPNFNALRQVKVKELEGISATVKIGVVKNSPRYAEALSFAQFVSVGCPDILRKHGFTVIATPASEKPKQVVVKKDPPSIDPPKKESAERPEIVVYAGSMLRPAIEETIKEFEKREGVAITRVYNGCGILVSQMKAGQRPDVYFSCDATFMNQVQDLFEESKVVSKNQLVIAVKKGNAHGIKSLKDLGKEGLRVGVGHEQQCALGVITEGVLIRSKVYKSVMENVKVRSPSGDLLVNQLRTGSLDAVVAYVSNVKPYEDDLEAIRVEEVNCQPSQPIAISKTTAHPDVVKRLLRSIESAQSKDRFEKLGFGWEIKP